MSTTDLIVAGAGRWAPGRHLALRGPLVRLLDAYGAGNTLGSSGDATRVMRASHGDDAFHACWSRRRASSTSRSSIRRPAGSPGWRAVVRSARMAASPRCGPPSRLRYPGRAVDAVRDEPALAGHPGRRPHVRAGARSRSLLARAGVEAVAGACRRRGRGAGDGEAGSTGQRQGAYRLVDVLTADGRRHGARIRVRRWPVAAGAVPRRDRRPHPGHQAGRPPPSPAEGDVRWHAPLFPGLGRLRHRVLRQWRRRRAWVKVATDSYGGPWIPDTMERAVDPGQASGLVRAYCERRASSWPPRRSRRPTFVNTRPRPTATSSSTVIRFTNAWLVGGGSGHGFKHGPAIGAYVVSLLDGHQPTGDERQLRARPSAGIPAGLRTRDAARS